MKKSICLLSILTFMLYGCACTTEPQNKDTIIIETATDAQSESIDTSETSKSVFEIPPENNVTSEAQKSISSVTFELPEPDWRDSTMDFLYSTYGNNIEGYNLCDIDGDDKPELVVGTTSIHVAGVDIYRYNEYGNLKPVKCLVGDGLGSYGSIYCDISNHKLLNIDTHMGVFNCSVFTVNGCDIIDECYFSDNIGTGDNTKYWINQKEVSRSEYEAVYTKYLNNVTLYLLGSNSCNGDTYATIKGFDLSDSVDNDARVVDAPTLPNQNALNNPLSEDNLENNKSYMDDYNYDMNTWYHEIPLHGEYDSKYPYDPQNDYVSFGPSYGVVKTDGSTLNVRATPGVPVHSDFNNKIGALANGTEVTISSIESTNRWYCVSGISTTGKQIDGYVLSDFIEITGEIELG